MANRILIADDGQKFRAAAAELLAARGFELIEEAADGNEALSAIARACPDGIPLDINLPGRDGLAVDWRSPSLSKMLVTCRSTAATVTTSFCAIRRWRAFGDQRKHVPLSRRQVVEGACLALAAYETHDPAVNRVRAIRVAIARTRRGAGRRPGALSRPWPGW